MILGWLKLAEVDLWQLIWICQLDFSRNCENKRPEAELAVFPKWRREFAC